MPNTSSGVALLIRENLHPLTGAASDYDPQIQQIGDARFVLSANSKGNLSEIAISLGKTSEDLVTHTITEPTRVWIKQTSMGANAALEIEPADQVKTLLRFRSALPADMVDGVVLEKSR